MPEHLWTTRLWLSVVALAMAGCASAPADLGRGEVETLVSERGLPVDAATDELLASLTAEPLTSESAVRVALLNNPGLQAKYAALGFGAADVYEAGRIRNPVLTGALLDSDVAGESNKVTLGLVASFTDLVTLRSRSRLSRGAFAALQQSVAAEVLAVAAETEKAYYRYVAAQQVASLRAQVAKAGALSAALAERFRDAGNLAARELALERAAASAARLLALEAEAEAFGARTGLADMLGMSVGDPWRAPAALHLPLEREDEMDVLLAMARDTRLDLAAARTRADVLADQLGVINWTRWLGELDVGIERERETDGARLTGPTVDWEVPLFNQHKDALLRADADLQVAISDVRRLTLHVDNSVRLAYAGLNNARARVEEYRQGLIPQRVEAVARAQEEVNYMLIGIFELIALKQDEYDAYQGYLEAIRDYWLARADLSLAAGGSLPGSAQDVEQRIDVGEFIAPTPGGKDQPGPAGAHDHSQMMKKGSDSSATPAHDAHGDRAPAADTDAHNRHDHGDSQ